MKKVLFISLSLIALTACHTSGVSSNVTQLRSPEGLSHSYNYLDTRTEEFLNFKNSMNLFASKMSESYIKREFDQNKNVALAPVSIEMALFLASACANGATREELENALGVSYEDIQQYAKLYFNNLSFLSKNESNQTEGELSITNSIWIDDEVELKDSGLDTLRDVFYSYSYHADFNGDNKGTNDYISNFIKDKTRGVLNPKLNISPNTLFVLMNTLYLKDIWNEAGEDLGYASVDYKFTNLNGKVSSKRLLQGNYTAGKVITGEDFTSFYSMTRHGMKLYFVKPNEGKDIVSLFNQDNISYLLDDKNIVSISHEKKEIYHTRCIFPEYVADSDADIMGILKDDFKVETLFDPSRCDCSNISNDPVYCSEVRHIAKLKVNKKGMEGAAVTYMAYAGASAPLEGYTDVYSDFVIDEACGFVLTNAYNDIIFAGTLTNID